MNGYEALIGKPEAVVEAMKNMISVIVLNKDHRVANFTADDINTIKKVSKILAEGSKGFMLVGNTGIGKSVMQDAARRVYGAMYNVATDYIPAKNMINCVKSSEGNLYAGMHYTPVIVLDDVGSEYESYTHYGQKIKPFIEIINDREDLVEYSDRHVIFSSTNLSLKQMNERYGSRIISRLAEQLKFIDSKGKDRRLQV